MDSTYLYFLSVFGACLLPAATLAVFRYVGESRRIRLRAQLEAAPRLASTYFAEFAAYKYELFKSNADVQSDRDRFLQKPGLVTIAVFWLLTAGCFALSVAVALNPGLLTDTNIFLVGFHKAQQAVQNDGRPALAVADFQLATSKFYTITFAVAYLWTIYFLLQKAVEFELTPVDFLQASLHVMTALFLAYIAWPLVSGVLLSPWATLTLTLIAIALGLHQALARWPAVYVAMIRRFAGAFGENGRKFGSLFVIEGIDVPVLDELAARGIKDVDVLAMANPVLLFTETTIGLHRAIHLVAQAQLTNALGERRFVDMKQLGIRTVSDLEVILASEHEAGIAAVVDILRSNKGAIGTSYPHTDDERHDRSRGDFVELNTFIKRLNSSLQVQRMAQLRAALQYVAVPDKLRRYQDAVSDDLERRMLDTLATALAAPKLTKYSGWVTTKVTADVEDAGKAAIAVRFFEIRPDVGMSEEVSISEGEERDWIEFDLQLRVGVDAVPAAKQSVTVPATGNSKDYVMTTAYNFSEKPELLLEISQRNRLIQAVRVDGKAGG